MTELQASAGILVGVVLGSVIGRRYVAIRHQRRLREQLEAKQRSSERAFWRDCQIATQAFPLVMLRRLPNGMLELTGVVGIQAPPSLDPRPAPSPDNAAPLN